MSTSTNDAGKPKARRRTGRKRSTATPPDRARSAVAAPAKISAKEATVQVLRRAHGPLHVKDISERVLKMDGVSGLKGATPGATIAAMLSVENGKGRKGLFKRVDKGTYALREQSESKPEPKPEPKAEPAAAPAASGDKKPEAKPDPKPGS